MQFYKRNLIEKVMDLLIGPDLSGAKYIENASQLKVAQQSSVLSNSSQARLMEIGRELNPKKYHTDD